VRTVPRDPAVGLGPGATVGAPAAGVGAPTVGPPARRIRLPRRAALALVAVLAAGAVASGAIALTAGGTAERAAAPTGLVRIDGVSLQSANCENWWRASAAERGGAIAALTRSIGGRTPYGPGTTLPAARVHALFDRVCAPTFTRHFMLYEIYVRAAGFRSLGQ
jgi:hypothetical protein